MYDRGHRSAVAIACAGAFLAFLDATIVNIAFPDISSSFSGSGRDALSWVLDGYFVVIAALLVPAAALALVPLAIVEGNAWGWSSTSTLGCFAAAAILLAGVAWRSTRHPRPIVEPALFAHRSFRIGNLGTLLFAAAFFSLILGNVLFLTSVWGYTILQAGAATLPGPTASTLVAGPAGKLADRFGHRAVIVPGTLFFAAGVMVLRSSGAEPDWLCLWLPGSLLTGIGIGLAFP